MGTDLQHENNFQHSFWSFLIQGSRLFVDCLSLLVRPNFVSDRTGATTLPHLISTAVSVVYEKHQTASETKASETKLIIVLCSVDRLLARIRAAQTNFSELRTGLLRKQCRFRVTAQCSENQ